MRNLVSPLFTLWLNVEMLVINGWQSHVVFGARSHVNLTRALYRCLILLLYVELLDERFPS